MEEKRGFDNPAEIQDFPKGYLESEFIEYELRDLLEDASEDGKVYRETLIAHIAKLPDTERTAMESALQEFQTSLPVDDKLFPKIQAFRDAVEKKFSSQLYEALDVAKLSAKDVATFIEKTLPQLLANKREIDKAGREKFTEELIKRIQAVSPEKLNFTSVETALQFSDKSIPEIQKFCDAVYKVVESSTQKGPDYLAYFAVILNQSAAVLEKVLSKKDPAPTRGEIQQILIRTHITNNFDLIPMLVKKMDISDSDFETKVEIFADALEHAGKNKMEAIEIILNMFGGKEKNQRELTEVFTRGHFEKELFSLGAKPDAGYLFKCAEEGDFLALKAHAIDRGMNIFVEDDQQRSLFDIAALKKDARQSNFEFMESLWEMKEYRDFESKRIIDRGCKDLPKEISDEIKGKFNQFIDTDDKSLTPVKMEKCFNAIKQFLKSEIAYDKCMETLSDNKVQLMVFNVESLRSAKTTPAIKSSAGENQTADAQDKSASQSPRTSFGKQ